MATTAPLFFRYSNGEVTTEAADSFPWESPVPVNPFWDSFRYCVAVSFLSNFTDHELEKLPIHPDSTEDPQTKLHIARKLLQDKLAEEEAKTSPKMLYETDYKKWYGMWQGIYAMEDELNLSEAEQTVRMLVEKRPDESNVVPPHMLAEHLVKIGKYEEAEEVERPVCEWMDNRPHLGKDSPQALNARRIIAKALWFQGKSRRVEAEMLVAEIHALVEQMGGGKFKVYQEEEKKLNKEMMDEIKSKSKD